jgi:hypothetical protein
MKTRKQILKFTDARFAETTPKYVRDRIFIELLIDIRELLTKINDRLKKQK